MITTIDKFKRTNEGFDDGADTEYRRVIPRDLFNESKLLKCVGRLCLLIHDGLAPVDMAFEEDGEPFRIGQTDNALTITNLYISVKGTIYTFVTTYNSKSNYPLYLRDEEYTEHQVFDESGNFSDDFKEFCGSL